MMTAEEVIEAFDLEPLPGEGGYFRQTWICEDGSGRAIGTAIMYLVTAESFSALHTLDADEIFHFYLGDPCEQIVIHQDGSLEINILGQAIEQGQRVQTVVPAGTWQGTQLLAGGRWALVGTTMAPGFSHQGFHLASSQDLSTLELEVAVVAFRYLAEGA